MTNLHSAVYREYDGCSYKLNLRWSRDISKRLGIKRKDTVGAKLYIANDGSPRVAIRANPNPKKGFRALKLHQSGRLCDQVRLGVGSMFDYCRSTPSIYKFTGKTMYVTVPFDAIGDGSEHGL